MAAYLLGMSGAIAALELGGSRNPNRGVTWTLALAGLLLAVGAGYLIHYRPTPRWRSALFVSAGSLLLAAAWYATALPTQSAVPDGMLALLWVYAAYMCLWLGIIAGTRLLLHRFPKDGWFTIPTSLLLWALTGSTILGIEWGANRGASRWAAGFATCGAFLWATAWFLGGRSEGEEVSIPAERFDRAWEPAERARIQRNLGVYVITRLAWVAALGWGIYMAWTDYSALWVGAAGLLTAWLVSDAAWLIRHVRMAVRIGEVSPGLRAGRSIALSRPSAEGAQLVAGSAILAFLALSVAGLGRHSPTAVLALALAAGVLAGVLLSIGYHRLAFRARPRPRLSERFGN